MAVALNAIRSAAERVAASHGLEVVDVEFAGSAKDRILRVYLERNAEGRERLKAEIAAAGPEANADLPEALREGNLSPEQLSGITHEDCAEFSRDFGVLLDVEDLVPGSEYTLEASSPGLDRKLSRREDFQRFSGALVKVQTFEPVRNNRHWQGRLVGVSSQVPKSEGPGAPTIGSQTLQEGPGAPVIGSQIAQQGPGAPAADGASITIDLGAVKQNSKSRKTGVSMVDIALSNIEKAQLIPEI